MIDDKIDGYSKNRKTSGAIQYGVPLHDLMSFNLVACVDKQCYITYSKHKMENNHLES